MSSVYLHFTPIDMTARYLPPFFVYIPIRQCYLTLFRLTSIPPPLTLRPTPQIITSSPRPISIYLALGAVYNPPPFISFLSKVTYITTHFCGQIHPVLSWSYLTCKYIQQGILYTFVLSLISIYTEVEFVNKICSLLQTILRSLNIYILYIYIQGGRGILTPIEKM
jgi:hypothetical protein